MVMDIIKNNDFMNEESLVHINLPEVGTITAPQGTTLLELSERYADKYPLPIMVAQINNELQDLTRKILYDCTVEFKDITDFNGYRTYQRGVLFMMIYAIKSILNKKTRVVVAHSVNKNYHCELPDFEGEITDDLLLKVTDVMKSTAEKNMPIERISLPMEKALKLAEEFGLDDKIKLLHYRHSHTVSFYKLDWLYNYFTDEMPPTTGRLNKFKLVKRGKGFILQFPDASLGYQLDEDIPENRISEIFKESNQWARIMKADTVAALNDTICLHGSKSIIQVAEGLQEKKIAQLADQIHTEGKRIVFIAGPSSSGKTTFASRLGIQLRVNGMIPHVISLDNYYISRDICPRDEFGKLDLESIDAIDTAQICTDLKQLLEGNDVPIPSFDFIAGRREYKGNSIKLSHRDVLIIEGIHGLNLRICEGINPGDTFKIFISALTQINIDDHNRITTTDTRLLRRIVRDSQFRGYSAAQTIDIWPSVMRGETKYIYPNQSRADAFYNSALVYEMAILKQYAVPLLYGINPEQPEYTEARRLIKFLDPFLGISSENVPPNSILREFIGGGMFAGH